MKQLHPNVYKTVFLYVGGIISIFVVIWILLGLVLPQMNLSLLGALSNVFGLELPESMLNGQLTPLVTLVMGGLVFFSILLLIVHVLFEAFITAQLISPTLHILTSRFGVLSSAWQKDREHILVRLLNYEKTDLVDVRILAVITVREQTVSPDDEITFFMAHFPVTELTPAYILALHPRMPWTIAVPTDQTFTHTLNSDYKLHLGRPIEKPAKAGHRLIASERRIEILIKGRDTRTSASFSSLHKIDLDSQKDGVYTLHLKRGKFADLPMHVEHKDDLNSVEESSPGSA